MYFDGSVMKEGAGVGLVFISPLGVRMKYLVRLHFPVSNNVTEYEALINGLRIAVELGIRRLEIRGFRAGRGPGHEGQELHRPEDGGILPSCVRLRGQVPRARTSRVASSLSNFKARLEERNLSLYKLMKKSDHFTWTLKAQEVLDSLKNMLKSPPILTTLTPEEPMLLYISATTQVVSTALVVKREELRRSQKVQ
jgi:hypothetical protein